MCRIMDAWRFPNTGSSAFSRNWRFRAGDYVVTGSGPLLAHGLKAIHDLDLVARGQAWELASARAPSSVRNPGFGRRIVLYHGDRSRSSITGSAGPDVDAMIEGPS
jgi:hypothetical protein